MESRRRRDLDDLCFFDEDFLPEGEAALEGGIRYVGGAQEGRERTNRSGARGEGGQMVTAELSRSFLRLSRTLHQLAHSPNPEPRGNARLEPILSAPSPSPTPPHPSIPPYPPSSQSPLRRSPPLPLQPPLFPLPIPPLPLPPQIVPLPPPPLLLPLLVVRATGFDVRVGFVRGGGAAGGLGGAAVRRGRAGAGTRGVEGGGGGAEMLRDEACS